jgi:hypothetical protein
MGSDIPAGFRVVSAGSSPRRPRSPDAFDLEPAAVMGREFGTVTSTVRDPEHNRRVGGSPRSYHLPSSGGRALDIARKPGVRHADIEAAYKALGADLIESLDEGDHSHFAFRKGPDVEFNMSARAEPPPSDIPAGFQVVSPGASDPKADRIATIKQNGFPPEEEAELIRRVQAEPAPLVDAGQSMVVFKDEEPPKPSRPMTEQEQAGFLDYIRQPGVTVDQARAYADRLGFEFNNADAVIAARDEKLGVNKNIIQRPVPPRDTGTGRPGAVGRAVGQALTGNLAGEIQGLGNATRQWLDGSIPEGRSFSDQWGRNTDFFEGAYAFDRREYPVTTFGTELLASAAIPFGAGARGVSQLAKVGGAYGAVYGFGEGQGGPLDRLPSALAGAAFGAGGGAAIGKGIELATPMVRRASDAVRSRFGRGAGNEDTLFREAAYESAPVVQDGVQGSPGARPGTMQGAVRAANEAPEGQTSRRDFDVADETAAMAVEDTSAVLTGPVERQRDYLDLPSDVPSGFRVVSKGDQPLTPLRQIGPEDVRPGANFRTLTEEDQQAAQDALYPLVKRPDPNQVYRDAGVRPRPLQSFVRSQGGLADEGGELRHMGLPASLIHKSRGSTYDEMGEAAYEAGYFAERPTVPEFLEALGENRYKPDEAELVARHAELQEEAYRVDAFADAGAPLAEDVGRPITLEDLDELSPPDSFYEGAAQARGKIGNLNLERVDDPEEVSRLVQSIMANVPEVGAARGARRTGEELKLAARDLGVKPAQILKWRKGQGLPSDAELFAWRTIIHQGRHKLATLAKRSKGASDGELARFHNMVMKQAALERQLAGAAAEAGRVLQQFNEIARAGDMTDDAIKAYLRSAGGRATVETMGEAVIDLVKDPKAAGKYIQDVARVRNRDMANEYWVNALLSGLGTHLVNFGGNGLVALLSLPEEAITAGVGALTRSADRVHLRDVGARAVGMVQGAREGLRLAKIAFKTGEPSDGVAKVEARNYQAIPGKLGHIIRTPSRALTAADEFWGEMHRRGALHAGAMRRALNEGGGREKVLARYEELRAAPDADLMKFTRDEALYRTFRKPLGNAGRSIQNFSNEAVTAKLVIPFVRTPINIIKYAGERSPLSPLAKPFWKDIQTGGRTRDEALGRLIMGSGLAAWAVDAAVNGRISGGGPTDPQELAALKNSGWQPYSVKIGDRWVSYQRFEPLSLIIGVTADFAELGSWATGKEADDIAMGVSLAIAKNITSKTWLSGLSDFFDVLSDPQRYGNGWVQRMIGTGVVPPVIGNAARAADPDVREVNSVLDAIKNRIPVLSRDLQARRDVWGEPLKRGSGAGQSVAEGVANYANPVFYSRETKDPLRREVARLKAPLSMPQRSLMIDGARVRLTPEQYSAYVQLSGQPAKQYFGEFIRTPEWRGMTDDEKREFMGAIMKEFREIARGELRRLYPELQGTGSDLPPGFNVVR